MTKLRAGPYRIEASGFNESCEHTVKVTVCGLHPVVFKEWTKRDVADDTPGPGY